MLKYSKIFIGLMILTLAVGVGYFAMPKKIETITETKTVVETKYVSVVDKTEVDALNVQLSNIVTEKEILSLEIQKLIAENSIEALKLKGLRAEQVENWIEKIEKKIVKFEDRIEPIDDAIEVLEDEIASERKSITLLQSQIESKQLLIDAFVNDDPIANLAKIRLLEDKIIVLNDRIEVIEEVIKDLEEEIGLKQEDKAALSDKITLDEKCISEIGRYIDNGADYSEEVSDRLEGLGLI